MSQSSILDSLKGSFGNSNVNGNGNGNKPNSEYWVNIGYMADDGQHFISLPKGGCPLDNMEPDKVSNPDSEYGKLLLAQNFLLEQLKEVAKALQPGEAKTIDALTVQVRRRKAAVEMPTNTAANEFIKKLF